MNSLTAALAFSIVIEGCGLNWVWLLNKMQIRRMCLFSDKGWNVVGGVNLITGRREEGSLYSEKSTAFYARR